MVVDERANIITSIQVDPKERKTRAEVVKQLRHEICKPADPVAAFRYEQENWGMDAGSNAASTIAVPTYGEDPGDGAV
jgi:hypothetical protein